MQHRHLCKELFVECSLSWTRYPFHGRIFHAVKTKYLADGGYLVGCDRTLSCCAVEVYVPIRVPGVDAMVVTKTTGVLGELHVGQPYVQRWRGAVYHTDEESVWS